MGSESLKGERFIGVEDTEPTRLKSRGGGVKKKEVECSFGLHLTAGKLKRNTIHHWDDHSEKETECTSNDRNNHFMRPIQKYIQV